MSQNLGWISTNALRTDLVAHCLELDMTFHKAHRPGEMIERIDGDVTDMFNFFSNMLVEVVSHLTLMLGVLIVLYLEDWRVGLAMMVFIGSAAFAMTRIHSYAVPRYGALREVVTRFYGFIGEVLASTEDIRASGAASKVVRRFNEILREWRPKRISAALAWRAMWASAMAILAVGSALAFGVGGVLWSRGIIMLGTVFMVFHYTDMLSMPLMQLQRQFADLFQPRYRRRENLAGT